MSESPFGYSLCRNDRCDFILGLDLPHGSQHPSEGDKFYPRVTKRLFESLKVRTCQFLILITDGLDVSFVYDNIPYAVDSIPVDSTFDIHLVNNTDSVLSIAISCRCKSASNVSYESIIIQTKSDEEPIVLVPGESIIIPSPFVRKENYFVYHINIYGSPHFFILQDKPGDERYFIANAENKFDLSTVKRYYYVTNEK